jgi:hypothetical protein
MTPRAAWLTTVTLVVAITTYSMAVPGSEIVLLMLPLVVVVRYFAYTREQPLAPQWIVAAVTFLAVVFAGLRVLRLGAEIDVLAEFVAILAVIKSLERWSARDDMQILIISIFLVLAAAISSSTLIIGILLLIFVPLLGYTAMRLQIEGAIRFGQRKKQLVRQSNGADPGPLFGTFVTALLLVSGISIVAFVLLPRGIGGDTLGGFNRPVMGRATGFRNSVELGRGGLISNDETVVMEVEIRDLESGNSLGAIGRVHYLRGNALSIYKDRKWTSPLDSETDRRVTRRQAANGIDFTSHNRQAVFKQTIRLTPSASDSGMLFSVWQPVEILFPDYHESKIHYDTSRRTMRLDASRTQLTEYEVLSNRVPLYENNNRHLFRKPDRSFAENDVVFGLAEAVLRDKGISASPNNRSIPNDARAVEAIEDWLSATGGFTYSLDIEDAPIDIDPIEWFLTEAKSGHCEYYASAMVGMCRSVGINSRVVTGYVMAEYNTEKESYTVRRSNAHAWVEAEIRQGVWESFDPTPNVFALHTPEESQLRFLRRILDTIDGFWLTSIVSYNKNNQMDLFGFDAQAKAFNGRNSQEPNGGKRVLRVAVSVVISLVGAFFLYRWYRKPSLRKSRSKDVDLPRAAYEVRQRLLAHWKSVGRERPEWAGLKAHASSEAEIELASMLLAAAFGSTLWEDRHTARSNQLLATLKASISR